MTLTKDERSMGKQVAAKDEQRATGDSINDTQRACTEDMRGTRLIALGRELSKENNRASKHVKDLKARATKWLVTKKGGVNGLIQWNKEILGLDYPLHKKGGSLRTFSLPASVKAECLPILVKKWSFGTRYGERRNGILHSGQDIYAKLGTPVFAVFDGLVVLLSHGWRQHDNACDEVWIQNDDGLIAAYCHVAPRDDLALMHPILATQVLGEINLSGMTDDSHLHFSLCRVSSDKTLPVETANPRDFLQTQSWSRLPR